MSCLWKFFFLGVGLPRFFSLMRKPKGVHAVHKRIYTFPSGRALTAEYPTCVPSTSFLRELKNRQLICPGCSEQDIFFGRCHASLIATKFGASSVVGMQCVGEEWLKVIMHAPCSCFVGRRPPRGMRKVWPDGMCRRSPLSNPFVVSQKNFSLAESLALYDAYMDNGFQPLADDVVASIVASTTPLASNAQILSAAIARSLE